MKNIKDLLKAVSNNEKSNIVFGENKVIFVTGGPGSGKDVIIREIISKMEITEMNHMQIFNYLTDSKKLKEKSSDLRRESIRSHFPLIINAPADDKDKIFFIKESLEEKGYISLMIFVDTTNEASIERNKKLSRMMMESVRQDRWISAQVNKILYNENFGNFIDIDNSGTIDSIEKNINKVYKKVNIFLESDAKEIQKTTIKKYNPEFKAAGPDDMTPDNRANEPQSDDIKYDAGKRTKSYIFKTYSESEQPKMITSNKEKVTNFSKDKEITKQKRFVDSPTTSQRMRNVSGLSPEFDTRQQGTVYPMSGLGNVTYREQKEFKNFRSKIKEAIDDPGTVDMGVGGVLGGASNKEPLQSYSDADRNMTGITITKKKGKKNVQ
jgi:dephospho-CoA kinase